MYIYFKRKKCKYLVSFCKHIKFMHQCLSEFEISNFSTALTVSEYFPYMVKIGGGRGHFYITNYV